MNKLLYLGALLLLTAGVSPAQNPTNKPVIFCAEPSYDFGMADSTETITHVFSIENKGTLSLEIKNVRPSCGCTVAKLSDRVVAPGQSATIETALSLKGRKGKQQKTIRVQSNDPDNSTLTLMLTGEVASNLTLDPGQVYFGQLNQLEDKSMDVDVKLLHPTDIKAVVSQSPFIKAVMTTLEDTSHYKVTVSTVPPLKQGAFATLVVLQAGKDKAYSIPVAGNVVGPLIVAPGEFLVRLENRAPVVRYAVIRPGQVGSFNILNVESPNPAMRTQLSKIGKDGYRLQVSNIVPSESLEGQELIIHTDAPGMESVRIPFRVVK
ncbi:MAG: DUF1573 domain-containing protein [Spartobacteria bacterium]|nr:DUF1573 domain-containing protein [Spartobacteria bacterium]